MRRSGEFVAPRIARASQQVLHGFQSRDRSCQSQREKRVEDLAHEARRACQSESLLAHRGAHRARRQVEEVRDDLVRMLGRDSVGIEDFRREIGEVVRDNDTRLTTNRTRRVRAGHGDRAAQVDRRNPRGR